MCQTFITLAAIWHGLFENYTSHMAVRCHGWINCKREISKSTAKVKRRVETEFGTITFKETVLVYAKQVK